MLNGRYMPILLPLGQNRGAQPPPKDGFFTSTGNMVRGGHGHTERRNSKSGKGSGKCGSTTWSPQEAAKKCSIREAVT